MAQPKVRYFTIVAGQIYSCCSDARNMKEAIEAGDNVDAESVIAISEETADFIASQF